MADEKTTPSPSAAPAKSQDSQTGAKAEEATKPVAKAKPPAIEDKPFTEFIQQDFLPALTKALKEQGVEDVDLSFTQQPLGVFGVGGTEPYWQVQGLWRQKMRHFAIAFTRDNINGPKLFYCCDRGSQPSTIEQFMGDERKATLDLMVLFALKRLNGQKWLARN
ncbi:MAG: DUF2996 domain-containing protein [Cyanobacteriota bacterium]|nr:DUF2996 domain-containing protein [Cyanobacteriota bacterium]